MHTLFYWDYYNDYPFAGIIRHINYWSYSVLLAIREAQHTFIFRYSPSHPQLILHFTTVFVYILYVVFLAKSCEVIVIWMAFSLSFDDSCSGDSHLRKYYSKRKLLPWIDLICCQEDILLGRFFCSFEWQKPVWSRFRLDLMWIVLLKLISVVPWADSFSMKINALL